MPVRFPPDRHFLFSYSPSPHKAAESKEFDQRLKVSHCIREISQKKSEQIKAKPIDPERPPKDRRFRRRPQQKTNAEKGRTRKGATPARRGITRLLTRPAASPTPIRATSFNYAVLAPLAWHCARWLTSRKYHPHSASRPSADEAREHGSSFYKWTFRRRTKFSKNSESENIICLNRASTRTSLA